jgi:hypothetical protein
MNIYIELTNRFNTSRTRAIIISQQATAVLPFIVHGEAAND